MIFPSLSPHSRRFASNVRAAWRSGGLHYRLCGRQTFNFALPFLRGYCRRCAKPPVVCSAFARVLLLPLLLSLCCWIVLFLSSSANALYINIPNQYPTATTRKKITIFSTYQESKLCHDSPNVIGMHTFHHNCQMVPSFRNVLLSLQRSRRWHTTSERLGAAAASTTVYAGDKRSISHCLFRGATAAVAPNRQLGAGILSWW